MVGGICGTEIVMILKINRLKTCGVQKSPSEICVVIVLH